MSEIFRKFDFLPEPIDFRFFATYFIISFQHPSHLEDCTIKQLFSLSRSLSFNHDFLAKYKKRLDWKDKVNFKIHDITARLTNSCNTRIAQYLTK